MRTDSQNRLLSNMLDKHNSRNVTGTLCGIPLSELTKDELIACVHMLMMQKEEMVNEHHRRLDILLHNGVEI